MIIVRSLCAGVHCDPGDSSGSLHGSRTMRNNRSSRTIKLEPAMVRIIAASGLLLLLLFSPITNAQDSFSRIPGGFVSGNARIRILSPTLVRLEYSPSRSFTDSMTAVVVNRDWMPPGVSVTTVGGGHFSLRRADRQVSSRERTVHA